MADRRCVVTLATDHRQYAASLERLEASLADVGFSGELISWRGGSFPEGSPSHAEVPFAFKPYCLAEAARAGGELLLWLDASCIAVRPLDPIFDRLDRDGYVLFRNGDHRVGEWASDLALELFGLSRDDAMGIPEVNAAALGLNTGSEVGATFLGQWLRAAGEGLAFRGVASELGSKADYLAVKWNRDSRVSADPRVRGHRHDQTVAGILAAELAMNLTSDGLETYSEEKKAIGASTRIAIGRDAGRHEGGLASLRRIRRASRRGRLLTRLPRRPRRRGQGS
jgi:hypothetical protein